MLTKQCYTLAVMTDGERIKALMSGRNKAAFAREFGVPGGPSMISQHISGHRPVSVEAALAYARGFGVSLEQISPLAAALVSAGTKVQGRDADSPPPTTTQAGAQPLSLSPFDTPPSLNWEEMMQTKELPPAFVLEVPDGALAGRYEQGTRIVFERGAAAKIGKPVLVQDRDGLRWVRIYGNVRGERWQAIATDAAHISLDSEADRLVVLAVAKWVEA